MLYRTVSKQPHSGNEAGALESLGSSDPEELGDIVIRGRLGQGGMGTVYYGVTPDGDQVAVKTIREDMLTKTVVKGRFEREILALGMVQGPRVSALVAVARDDEVPQWFATDYVQGLTLSEYVKEKGPLTLPMVAALGLLLTEALAEIHSAGILHRDFKPGNILLGDDGPKVIDFGLAALADVDGDITRTKDLLGTPHCMAPEQVRTPKQVTKAIDIYALGAVLAFAATKHHLYDRPDMHALLFAIADEGIEPDLSGLPEPLRKPVQAMLAHAPGDRLTLDEIAATLTVILADNGLTPAEAQRQFAALTYMEREADPEPERKSPQPVRRGRMADNPHVPSTLVGSIAQNLRRTYAREAVF
jgi:serine/threonine protein kinase